MLNRRVDLHAIDATPARWRGGVGSSLHPTHWLICAQVDVDSKAIQASFANAGKKLSSVDTSGIDKAFQKASANVDKKLSSIDLDKVAKTAAQPTTGASQTVAPASALAAFPKVLEGGDEREGSPLSIMMAAVAPLREAMTAFARPPAASTLPPLIEDEDIDAQAASIVQHLVETASPETSRATSMAALRRARSEHRASSRRRRYSAPSFSITTAADGMDPSGRSTSMPNARPPSFSVEPTLETPTNGGATPAGGMPRGGVPRRSRGVAPP